MGEIKKLYKDNVRLLCSIAAVVIVLFIVVAGNAMASEIKVGSAEVNQHDVFNITVYLANVTNVTGLNFTLLFDKDVVRVIDVQPLSQVIFEEEVIDNSTGILRIVAVTNLTSSVSPVPVLNITFYALNTGFSYLNLTDVEISDETFNVTAPDIIVNGYIIVSSPRIIPKFSVGGNAKILWNASYQNISAFEMTDLNGDGAEDFIFVGSESKIGRLIYKLYALNGITGEELWNISLPQNAYYITIDDINGDGIKDVVVVGDKFIWAVKNDGSSVLIRYFNNSISYFDQTIGVDVDGDGFKELTTGGWGSSWNFYVMVIDEGINNTKWSKAFESWSQVIASNSGEKNPPVKIANVAEIKGFMQNFNFDFNSDGKGDILIIYERYNDVTLTHEVNILALNGENGNTIWNRTYEGSVWLYSKVDDLNGDGVKELLFGGYTRSVILSGADGNELWNSSQDLVSGCFDYDTDGVCEFMTYDGNKIYMRGANGNEEWNYTFGSYESVWSLKGSVIVIGRNYDWMNDTTEIKVVKFDNDGNSLWSFERNLTGQLSYYSIATDLTGDGVRDVLFTGHYYHVLALDGADGNELWSMDVLYLHYIGDFDGDGKGDVFNVTAGEEGFAPISGEGLTGDSLAYIFNVSSSAPFAFYFRYFMPYKACDLNGDGLSDMVFVVEPNSPNSTIYAVGVKQPPTPEPDLTVNLEVPNIIRVNEQFQINIMVKNIGTASSSATTLNLYIDGNLVSTFNVPSLTEGQSERFTYQYTFASEGLHVIRAVVDPNNNVGELNEGNNEIAREVVVYKPKPDLVGYLHVFDEFGNETDTLKIHKAGDTWKGDTYAYPFVVVNVSFEIRNLEFPNTVDNTFSLSGIYRSQSFNYAITQEQLSDLNADGVLYINDTVVVDVSNIDVGCYSFNVTVDSNNDVEELNETNNNATYIICLSKPDLVPILEVPYDITPGTYNFTVGVVNAGDVWAKATKLKVYINGSSSYSREYDVPTLMPREFWLVNISYDFTGTYEIKVVADYYDDETELDEGNNIVAMNVSAIYKEVNATIIPNVTTAMYNDIFNVTLIFDSQSPVGKIDLELYYPIGALRYISGEAVNNVSISDGGWKLLGGMWFRSLKISGHNLNLNGTFWVADLTFQVVTDRNVTAMLNLSGDVWDVNGIKMVLNPINASVQIERYTDVYPYIWGYPWQIVEGENMSFKVTVRNLRGTPTNPIGLEIYIFNENDTVVWNKSLEIQPLSGWGYNITEFTWTPPAGTYYIVAEVYNDSNPENNIAKSYGISVKKLEVDAWRLWYPYWKVLKNSTFTVFTYISSSAYVCGAKITVNVPDGLQVYNYSSGEWGQSYTTTRCLYESKWNYVGFIVKGVDIGKYGNGTTKEINITVNIRGKSDTINSTMPKDPTDWIPNYPLEVFVPIITLYSINSTVMDSSTNTTSMTFKTLDVNNVTTFAQNITIVVQAGQDGRILRGLDYLVYYPYGCVEQTTSAMLGALHVDWYYREVNKGYPLGYDEEKVNSSIEIGVRDLAKGGIRGQHDNGSWSMWGGNPRGDGFYTMYASYGLGRVAEDTKYGHLVKDNITVYHTALQAPGKFNFNDTIYWFAQTAKRGQNGEIWWEPWQGTHWFFSGHLPVTAWVMVAHYQLAHEGLLNQSAMDVANQTMASVTKYLISVQNSDGGWNQWGDKDNPSRPSDAISTALAVWGLKLYGTPSAGVNETQIENAINKGIEWLLSNYYTKDSNKIYWKHPLQSPWWDNYGRQSEATAYALIAMNESRSMFLSNFTVLDSQNETVRKAINYLISVYRTHGSFGYTAATQAALHALTLLQVVPIQDTTLEIAIDGILTKSISVNSTSPMVVVKLNKTEIDQINSHGVLQDSKRRIHTVVINKSGGFVIVSIENEQTVARNEITWGVEYIGQRILKTGGSETTVIKTLDSEILVENQNTLTITPVIPDGIIEGNTYQFEVRINNTNSTVLLSPIVKIHLSGAKFNVTGAKWYDSELGWLTFTDSNMNVIDNYTVELFPDQIPPNGYIRIVFSADVEENSANVTMDVSVTPMYAETQTFVKSSVKSVTGYGNVNLNVYDINGTMIDANVYVDNNIASTSIKAIEGLHTIRIKKSGYVPIEFSVNLARGDNVTYTVILAKPEELDTPRVIFAQAVNFTELENAISITTEISKKPNATVKAHRMFSMSVTGDGEKIIAVRVPKLERGSLWAWLNDSIRVEVNGQSVTPEEKLNGNESVLLIKVNGSANINISFEGRQLGAVDPSDNKISMKDIQAIARYILEKDYNLEKLPQWTSILWKKPIYGAVDPSDDRITMKDIQAIARYILERDYNLERLPQWTSVLWGQ